MTDRNIEVRDVGPIERLQIPVPAGGGIVVLHGLNGSGKSRALEAVSALVGSGGARPVSRDGSLGATVEGLGARLSVGRRTAVSGEVEVTHLEGEDPSLLVDPGIKDVEAADAERIRALLRLSRAKVDASAFARLVGSEARLRELCRIASLEQTDVPAMAAAIKRDLEAEARKTETISENALAKSAGIRATLKELGEHELVLQAPTAEAARTAHTEAVRQHAAGKATMDSNSRMRAAASEARAALDALGIATNAEALERDRDLILERARSVEVEIRRLEDERLQLKAQHTANAKGLAQQQRDREQRIALERTLAATDQLCDEPDLGGLATRVVRAQAEAEAWGVRSRTERVRAEIDQLERQGLEAATEAQRLRNAAKGTESVVLEAVRAISGDDVELHDGRIYVTTDRGRELFSDLSQGERWRRALDIAVKAVGASGLLVVRQEAYESLDPINRREIAEYARKIGVVILTAEASEGEIRADVLESGATAAE